ncbi:MAG: ATP-binding protein [Bacteroidia bacterium]
MERQKSYYARSLIEATLDPLFVIDPSGKIKDVNEATLRATGETREDLNNTDMFLYFTESEKVKNACREIFAKGFITDYSLTIKDGVKIPVLCSGSVYRDDLGHIQGAVIVARDVTEQTRIAAELTEAKNFADEARETAEEATRKAESATKIAVEAVKTKQQFLSNMSHEIRTPMNAIIGFTKIALKTDLSAKQREYLDAIKVSGDTLIVLINDILDLAKVDAGKMTFEEKPFKMANSISAMLHLFETKIQEKNLALIKEYDDKIPKVLVGDSIRLHQIILNLVSNAVKFTNSGQITVSVHLIEEDDKTVKIEFAVKDTGIGIPENKINGVFENFQQANIDTSRLYGGTGLGLAIVKQLVEAQSGTIHVKSKVSEGSTFSFILMFQKTNEEADSHSKILELDREVKNLSILVVEDIALNQLLMKTLLDDFGFGCDIAVNGKIAIEKLRSRSYDLILMDLQMPEMNGFETTDYIRNTMNLHIPIIALTADVTTVDIEKCKSVGMNDYIAKPVDEKLLYSKIVGLVKNPTIPMKNESDKSQKQILRYTNMEYLNERTKSNPSLMMQMISIYLEQTPPLIKAMKQSFKDKDWEKLHATIHKMIPSFSIVGLHKDYELIAKKIQEYANLQKKTDDMNELVAKLEIICKLACKELEEEFNAIKQASNEQSK